MRYSDIENINLGHRQLLFGFESNLSQEQNAVMECLADQIKQHGYVVLSKFVPYVKKSHGLSEFKILQYILWIAQDFKIQFRINNKNLEPFDGLSELDQMIEKMKSLLDTHNANMDLRNRALYSLRQIKARVEKAESIHAVNLCLNDAEYRIYVLFDVLLENGGLPSHPKQGSPLY